MHRADCIEPHLGDDMYSPGGILKLRDMADTLQDADVITYWKNLLSVVRDTQIPNEVYTPDTYRSELKARPLHSFLWIIDAKPNGSNTRPVGFTSLYVDIDDRTGQYIPVYIDPSSPDTDTLAIEAEYLVISYAFAVLQLRYIWVETIDEFSERHIVTGFVVSPIDKGRTGFTYLKCVRNAWIARKEDVKNRFGLRNLTGV